MAKSLRDYSSLAIANVPVGPAVNTETRNCELRIGLIMMVQANQFCGLLSEDTSAHLQHFLELFDTIVIKDVAPASIRLRLFPFSLAGKAKQWSYQSKEAVDTWDKCSAMFLVKFSPWAKPVPYGKKIPTSSKLHSSPSLKRGKGSRITFGPVRITEWKIGSCSRISMKG
jgi:hypothetical protein